MFVNPFSKQKEFRDWSNSGKVMEQIPSCILSHLLSFVSNTDCAHLCATSKKCQLNTSSEEVWLERGEICKHLKHSPMCAKKKVAKTWWYKLKFSEFQLETIELFLNQHSTQIIQNDQPIRILKRVSPISCRNGVYLYPCIQIWGKFQRMQERKRDFLKVYGSLNQLKKKIQKLDLFLRDSI